MNGNVVKVVLWGKTVGYLSWDKTNWRAETSIFQSLGKLPVQVLGKRA